MANENFDFIVIGGGSAGLVAAGGAGVLGAKVALIENRALGGDCLYTGCVPSKTLIRSARFAADVKNANKFGFSIPLIKFKNGDFAEITNRVRRVIETIEPHDSPERFEQMGVRVIFGEPRFLNSHEIAIALKDSNETRVLTARRFCIATGSSPAIPRIEGLREAGFLTNENVFEIKELPEKLVILGGGAIGVELGQSFARFGSQVTIIEPAARILAKEDQAVSELMQKILRAENVEILTGARAVAVRRANGTKFVKVEQNDRQFEIGATEILAAVGRKPNVGNLDLEKANVNFDDKRIFVDDYLRTTARHIFAAGDVTGRYQFTHAADSEAQTVLNNAFLFAGLRKKIDFRAFPWATFTDPEIGRVGLTEAEAREKFADKIRVYKVEFVDNDRANAEDETAGFAKIVCRANNEIVGAHLVGANAGEIIHEFVWAMKYRLKIKDLNKIVRVYPTLSKIVQAAATEATLETLRSPFVQKWFRRYLKIWR